MGEGGGLYAGLAKIRDFSGLRTNDPKAQNLNQGLTRTSTENTCSIIHISLSRNRSATLSTIPVDNFVNKLWEQYPSAGIYGLPLTLYKFYTKKLFLNISSLLLLMQTMHKYTKKQGKTGLTGFPRVHKAK